MDFHYQIVTKEKVQEYSDKITKMSVTGCLVEYIPPQIEDMNVYCSAIHPNVHFPESLHRLHVANWMWFLLDHLSFQELPKIPDSVKILTLESILGIELAKLPRDLKTLSIVGGSLHLEGFVDVPPNLEYLRINNGTELPELKISSLANIPKTVKKLHISGINVTELSELKDHHLNYLGFSGTITTLKGMPIVDNLVITLPQLGDKDMEYVMENELIKDKLTICGPHKFSDDIMNRLGKQKFELKVM